MGLRDLDTLASPAQVDRHYRAMVAWREAKDNPRVPVGILLSAWCYMIHTSAPLTPAQMRAVTQRVKAERGNWDAA